MTRTSRNLMVGLMVTVGLAGIGWTASADQAQSSTVTCGPGRSPGPAENADHDRRRTGRRCWTGIRSSSTRSLRRIRRTPPVSGSGRSFTRRSSMPTTASNGATHRFSFTAGRPHGASRRAAVIAAAYTALVGLFPSRQPALDASYAASLAALSDDCEDRGHRADDGARARRASSAASPGEPRSRRPCSPGARPMGSARATRRSPVGPRSASGGRHRRRSDR